MSSPDLIYLVCSTTGESTTSVNGNSNKFHKWTKRPDGNYDHNYGRVGTPGVTHSVTESKMQAKMRDALNHGYTQVEVAADVSGPSGTVVAKVDLRQKAVEEIAGGDKGLADLVGMLADKNTRDIVSTTTLKVDAATGLFKTDGGVIVTRKVVDEARVYLGEVKRLHGRMVVDEMNKLACDYLMRIPTDIGRRRPTFENVFPDEASILKQSQILDSLLGSLDMLSKPAPTPADSKTESKPVWSVKLIPVDAKEMKRIDKKFHDTYQRAHACAHLRPSRAWELHISHMDAGFAKDGALLDNRQELWHGTRTGNLLSILARGLIIPPWCDSGSLFGRGAYFSDISTKSLNYAYGYWGGGSKDNRCYMLLNDVGLGKQYIPPGGGSWTKAPPGYDSVWAVPGKSGILNNEMIVYRETQYTTTRLVEFGVA